MSATLCMPKFMNFRADRCQAANDMLLRHQKGVLVSSQPIRKALMSGLTIGFALLIPAALAAAETAAPRPASDDPVAPLVARLDLERYKATIKGLTRFGDRRQGTDRNRQAIDWIETQLKSYGCANIERLKYDYQPPNPDTRSTMANTAGGPGTPTPADFTAVGAGRPR